jgi:hypothetical protein
MSGLQKATHHVCSHPTQTDHSQLHGLTLLIMFQSGAISNAGNIGHGHIRRPILSAEINARERGRDAISLNVSVLARDLRQFVRITNKVAQSSPQAMPTKMA